LIRTILRARAKARAGAKESDVPIQSRYVRGGRGRDHSMKSSRWPLLYVQTAYFFSTRLNDVFIFDFHPYGFSFSGKDYLGRSPYKGGVWIYISPLLDFRDKFFLLLHEAGHFFNIERNGRKWKILRRPKGGTEEEANKFCVDFARSLGISNLIIQAWEKDFNERKYKNKEFTEWFWHYKELKIMNRKFPSLKRFVTSEEVRYPTITKATRKFIVSATPPSFLKGEVLNTWQKIRSKSKGA